MGQIESAARMIFQSLILRSGPKDRVSKDEAGTVRLRPSFETPASRAPQRLTEKELSDFSPL
jgi:hypothetical protein